MFSVVIPAYKARFLADAIRSVLAQTLADFELVIVNDDSPENIDGVVAGFSDPRIRYHRNATNLGRANLVRNWNHCVSLSTREYVVLFSDDDILQPGFLAEMRDLWARHPSVDVCYARVAVIDSAGAIRDLAPAAPEWESCLDFIWHRVHNFRLIYAQNFAFRRSALDAIGGFVEFPLAWGSDDATWFSLAAYNGIASSSKILCHWRWSDQNISNVGNFDRRLEAIELYDRWLTGFVENYPPEDGTQAAIKTSILHRLPARRAKTQAAIVERLFRNQPLVKGLGFVARVRRKYGLNNKTVAYGLALRFRGRGKA